MLMTDFLLIAKSALTTIVCELNFYEFKSVLIT